MCPIFVIKFSGVSDLQGVKFPVFPLTLLVIVTTVLSCDVGQSGWWCYQKDVVKEEHFTVVLSDSLAAGWMKDFLKTTVADQTSVLSARQLLHQPTTRYNGDSGERNGQISP